MKEQYYCKIIETPNRDLWKLKSQFLAIKSTSPERAAIKALTTSRSIKIAAWHVGSGIYLVTKSVNVYEDVVLGKVAVRKS